MLLLNDYSDPENVRTWNQVINVVNFVLTWLFTIESLMKIVAFGLFLSNQSYLMSKQHILDLIIVISGQVEFFQYCFTTVESSSSYIKTLRIFRVFRPLKAVTKLEKLRTIILALVKSVPAIFNVIMFLFFMFLLFGIIGLQSFNEVLFNRCRATSAPVMQDNRVAWPKVDGTVCSTDGSGYTCPVIDGIQTFCGNPFSHADNYTVDMDEWIDDGTIQFGVGSFSNFFSAVYTVMQIITNDSWTVILFNLMNGGKGWLAVTYCICIVIIGTWFLLNLFLAVVMQAYNNIMQKQLEKEQKEHKKQLEKAKQQTE